MRMVNVPAFIGSPCSTTSFAPLGNVGGASPHFISFGVRYTASGFCAGSSARAAGAITSTAHTILVFHVVITVLLQRRLARESKTVNTVEPLLGARRWRLAYNAVRLETFSARMRACTMFDVAVPPPAAPRRVHWSVTVKPAGEPKGPTSVPDSVCSLSAPFMNSALDWMSA